MVTKEHNLYSGLFVVFFAENKREGRAILRLKGDRHNIRYFLLPDAIRVLAESDTGWRGLTVGQNHTRDLRFREYFISHPDKNLNALAGSAAGINRKNFSTLALIQELMRRTPAPVKEAATPKP